VSATAGVITPTSIVFGTDGWRARIADDFTFENVRRCADGVAEYVERERSTERGVVIAYDRPVRVGALRRRRR
jgi:phosphomannomutase